MKKTALFFLFVLSFQALLFSQNGTFFGNVFDSESGEKLIGAAVLIKDRSAGVLTNSYGFYSLTVPQGSYSVTFSFVGYKTATVQIALSGDTTVNVALQPDIAALGEVIVEAAATSNAVLRQAGVNSLNLGAARLTPVAAGEVDIIKNLQYFPGIQTANEGTTNLSVRGGSFDQNLFLLDDAPIYNPSHALGFFSTFNPDAISSVNVYKSAFPARYGGKLSSIIDIRMKDGNNRRPEVAGGAGLIAGRLSVEAPIKEGRSSFIVSGRYSYAGSVFNAIGRLGQELRVSALQNFNANNEINFYDFNAKANFSINAKNHLYFSGYAGNDHFYCYTVNSDASMDWGNRAATARWNHILNSRLFSNATLIYSRYNYSYILKEDIRNFEWLSAMGEVDLKYDVDYFINPSNHMSFGIAAERHSYFPGGIEPRDSVSITRAFELEQRNSVETTAYLSNEQKIGSRITVNYGLRYPMFFLLGKGDVYSWSETGEITDTTHYRHRELIQYYGSPEPRFDLRYMINSGNSVKVSYTHVSQYRHLLSNSSLGLPTDIWVPAGRNIKPQRTSQYSAGYYSLFYNSMFELSVELYYKQLFNIIDYRDNADLFLNPQVEASILSGRGEAYGVEFYVEKKKGNLTGWFSYSLSKVTRQIEGINAGRPYPASYDKRHNLSAALMYRLSLGLSAGAVFKYTSGGYITMPEGAFSYYGAIFNYYSERNGYELPPYHRLDISFTYKNPRKQNSRWKPELSFGIYNVYDHKNIFSLFVKMKESNMQAYKLYLYGITPYFTYNFRF
ncbi:MAG: TonB-dependent receptor [Bacteroidales bacterium]|jgi:hypothetical protein|nr:TonB-dependent receptor [Bacteroidales bacterium]